MLQFHFPATFLLILHSIFSTGQKYFALCFIIGFIILMIWAYRKDLPTTKTYYKNSWQILLAVLAILALLVWLINASR